MHENEYAYAVARVRANEVNLLSPAETEQLITAESYEAALRLLGDKRWHTDGVGHDYAPMLEEHVNAAWQLLKESAPDASLLDALVINNDFFNLKAALKAKFSDLDPSDYVVKPSVWDPAEIIGCVERNELDSLPECMRDCAQAAYDAIVKLESGRIGAPAAGAAGPLPDRRARSAPHRRSPDPSGHGAPERAGCGFLHGSALFASAAHTSRSGQGSDHIPHLFLLLFALSATRAYRPYVRYGSVEKRRRTECTSPCNICNCPVI